MTKGGLRKGKSLERLVIEKLHLDTLILNKLPQWSVDAFMITLVVSSLIYLIINGRSA